MEFSSGIQQTPPFPKDRQFSRSKTLTMEKIPIGKIPIYREKFEKFLQGQTVFCLFWLNEFKISDFAFPVSIEFDWVSKKFGIHVFSRIFSEKFSNAPRPYKCLLHIATFCRIRGNIPGALRPTKTLTGVLIGTENCLSLGGGEFAVEGYQNCGRQLIFRPCSEQMLRNKKLRHRFLHIKTHAKGVVVFSGFSGRSAPLTYGVFFKMPVLCFIWPLLSLEKYVR